MEFFPFLASLVETGKPLSTNCIVVFYALVIGHALADFPLQGDFLAMGKDRHFDLRDMTGKQWPAGTWAYCLTMHCLIHAGVVWFITGSIALSFIEFVLHWIIDYAKNEKWTNFFVDQSLHILCKAAYVYPFCAGLIP